MKISEIKDALDIVFREAIKNKYNSVTITCPTIEEAHAAGWFLYELSQEPATLKATGAVKIKEKQVILPISLAKRCHLRLCSKSLDGLDLSRIECKETMIGKIIERIQIRESELKTKPIDSLKDADKLLSFDAFIVKKWVEKNVDEMQFAGSCLKSDAIFIKQLIPELSDMSILAHVSYEIRNHPLLMLKAIVKDAMALKYASAELKKNMAFLDCALTLNPNTIEFIDQKIVMKILDPLDNSYKLEMLQMVMDARKSWITRNFETPVNVPEDGACLFSSLLFGIFIPLLDDVSEFTKKYTEIFGTSEKEPRIKWMAFLLACRREHYSDRMMCDDYLREMAFLFRIALVGYMQKHWESLDLASSIEDSHGQENTPKQKVARYLKDMAKQSSWGGAHEIAAASLWLKLQVDVFDEVNLYHTSFKKEKKLPEGTVYLIRTNQSHYQFYTSEPIYLKKHITEENLKRKEKLVSVNKSSIFNKKDGGNVDKEPGVIFKL